MVRIEKKDDHFTFEIIGLHKLWALKSQLTIPVSNVISATRYTNSLDNLIALRMPGTQIPGIITAGTYIVKDGTIFCDVVNKANSIEVTLQDEHYKRLIIEVEHPEEAIAMLTKKEDVR